MSTHQKKLKISLILVFSFLCSLLLINTIFLSSPHPNLSFIASFPKKITSFFSQFFSKKITPPTPKTSLLSNRSNKFYPIPTNSSTITPFNQADIKLTTPTPILILTLIPTNRPSPSPTKSTICPQTSQQSYQKVKTASSYTFDSPAKNHPEINLELRGYVEVQEKAGLVRYGGDTDHLALKINSIFADGRVPTIMKTYQVYAWDYVYNKRSSKTEAAWPVSLIGLKAISGESLVVPPSGRNITETLQLMVLYADENRITFTNSLGDNWTDGYILHVEDICTDPNLIATYNEANATGRHYLPALPRGQVFGTAKTNEVKVAIRDSGEFMDPRSDKDWW